MGQVPVWSEELNSKLILHPQADAMSTVVALKILNRSATGDDLMGQLELDLSSKHFIFGVARWHKLAGGKAGRICLTCYDVSSHAIDEDDLVQQNHSEELAKTTLFVVDVQGAKDIKDANIFGNQDCYVVAQWMPHSAEHVETRVVSPTAEGGGTDPSWGHKLLIKPSAGATGLRLQVFMHLSALFVATI